MKEYTLKRGDTLTAIAARERIPVEQIWGHPRNQELRKKRQRPELLYPGDVVFVPDVERKEVRGRTGAVHDLVVNLPRTPLRLRLLVDGEPCQGVTCTVQAEEQPPLTTDKDGKLELDLPAHLVLFKLKVDLPARPPREGAKQEAPRSRLLTFRVGHLENEIALLQARLTNLGFHCDPIDGKFGPRARRALLRFQKAFRLELTGKPDDRKALDELARLHEQDGSWSQRLSDEDKLCRSLDPPHHVLTGRWNRICLLEGPEVVIDAHMHVNSGNCCPMPLVWDKDAALRPLKPSRTLVNDRGVSGMAFAERAVIRLRAQARTVGDLLASLTDATTELTEAELTLLTIAVAKTLVAAAYVGEAGADAAVSTIDEAAGLIDAAGKAWKAGAALDRAASRAGSELERRLRAMVPDQAQRSAEVMSGATGLSQRMVAAVVNAFRNARDAATEVGRKVANGATEVAADAVAAGSHGLDAAAELEAELARIHQSTATELHGLASGLNRDLDLVSRDARDLVQYVADHVQSRVSKEAADLRASVRGAGAKAQALMASGQKTLADLRQFTVLGAMKTNEIASLSVEGNLTACAGLPPAAGERLSMMMVMPMDMDFGHIDGYLGEQIYQPVETRRAEDITLRPAGPPYRPVLTLARRPLPPGSTQRTGLVGEPVRAPAPGIDFVVERTVIEEPGPFYHYSEYRRVEHQASASAPPRVELVEGTRWLANDEFDLFKEYPEQVKDTLASAAENPWTLLPLYHYDPRRWSQPTGTSVKTRLLGGELREVFPQSWDEPFKRHFADPKKRPFVGFKQYTALGYRPWDPRLPRQKDFYDRCVSLDLPIVCHCSPGGMYSLERPLYVLDEARVNPKRSLADLRRETEELMRRRRVQGVAWEEYWFCEHYVSPLAWREVLGRYPKLRLCLAHFGGSDVPYARWTERDPPPIDEALLSRTWENNERLSWDDALVKLAAEHEGVYIDISYFLFDARTERFRRMLEAFPHLRDKILFGTDWWMTEKDGIDYKQFVEQARRALDSIDPELWPRFSWINPVRFYRLKEQAQAIAAALRVTAPSATKKDDDRNELIDRGLALLESLHPGGIGDK